MFRVFSLSQARELLQSAIPRHFLSGAIIIEKGSVGDEFYVVTSGIVTLTDGHWTKNILAGDYFGEMALVTGATRSASAIAKTEVDIIAFRKEDFLSILRGNTETINFILNLAKRRQEPSWQVISKNSVLSRMTNLQRTLFQASLVRKEFKLGESLWKVGSFSSFGFLLAEGQVQLDSKLDLEPFLPGAFIGETNSLLSGGRNATSCVTLSDGWGYTIDSKDWIEFLNRNPGVKLSFLDTNFTDVLKGDQLALLQSLKDPYSCAF